MKTQQHIDNLEIRGISMEVLNAIENAILRYTRKHNLGNAYWYFAEILGYKHKNHLYQWFADRDNSKVGFRDITTILRITQDKHLYEVLTSELKSIVE